MKKIPLTRGKYAYVDDDDFERLNKHNWFYMPVRFSQYAARSIKDPNTGKYKIVLMQWDILKRMTGLVIDHADNNGLNNQKTNIRYATRSQNCSNRVTHFETRTNVKGVYPYSLKDGTVRYSAKIMVNYKVICLGTYDTLEEGKMAYMDAAKKFHREFAHE